MMKAQHAFYRHAGHRARSEQENEHGLEQSKVVVLGGSSGMGLATVQRLASSSADIIAVGRNEARLAQAIDGLGEHVRGVALDCGDRVALDGFFARLGAFDHLVLTLSGGDGAGNFAELNLNALRRGFEEKFWPQINAAQASLPALRHGGSMTFLTAISARIANPGTAGLAAINAALESIVGPLARELAPTRVNAVSPGVIDTAWWNRMPADMKESIFRRQAETLPVGHVGQTHDVAAMVVSVMENPFMTGSIIECDGGLHLL
jgi:NAD(P)-dependent dehydrogenase (short-subunit alcohol dehydrogenase family)